MHFAGLGQPYLYNAALFLLLRADAGLLLLDLPLSLPLCRLSLLLQATLLR